MAFIEGPSDNIVPFRFGSDQGLTTASANVITCPQCKSPDVVIQATARWNVQKQEYELAVIHEAKACNSCGFSDTRFDMTPINSLDTRQRAFIDGELDEYTPIG